MVQDGVTSCMTVSFARQGGRMASAKFLRRNIPCAVVTSMRAITPGFPFSRDNRGEGGHHGSLLAGTGRARRCTRAWHAALRMPFRWGV